jgi:uncharacterized protein YjeT (DUF2065 family)
VVSDLGLTPAMAGDFLNFWQVLPVAIALLLIAEGLLPFISPGRWREMVLRVAELDDSAIRSVGLGCILSGVVLLYLVR